MLPHAIPLVLSLALANQTPTLKAPVRLETKDAYTYGAWDVGIATIAGQPTEKTLRDLKAKGYTTVVCFRTPQEMDSRNDVPFDEAALLKELGMKYIHLPLGGTEHPNRPEVVAGLAEAMKGNEGKILVHCTVGWRASYVWTAYLHKYKGMELNEAVKHGQAMHVSQFLEQLLDQKIVYTPEKKSGGQSLGCAPPAGTAASNQSPTDSSWNAIVSPSRALEMKGQGCLLLDVRANYMEYIDGHISGAVHMDANSLRGPKNGLPVQYRTDAEMAETLRLAGVSASNPVVIYANPTDILNATMTAYVLEKLGNKNSCVVDGGSAGAAGLIEKPIPTLEPGDFKAKKTANITATVADIKFALESGKVTLVDARPPAQYTGEQKLWVRNGHIPGAINVFWRTLTREDNAHGFRSKDEIAKIFADKGIRSDQDVIVYCGTSKEATLIWMVLSRELGFKKVRVFEGAWTEYASRTDLPVATGTNPK